MIGAEVSTAPTNIFSGRIAYMSFHEEGWRSGGTEVIRADWRDVTFTADSEPDDVAAINWDLQGTAPTYTPDSGGGANIINALTNVDGEASVTYDYIADQSVSGVARKATSSPHYREGTLSGVITEAGLDIISLLVGDE